MTGAWLAIDTATDLASVAARRPGGEAAVVTERGARRHAAAIIQMIDRALERAGIARGELAGILVADGPGSFTGLRIGWAAAKGLAHERAVPLRTAPSLLGAAFAAWQWAGAEPGSTVAACYDALRGQVFAGLWRFSPPDAEQLVAPAVMTLAELARVAPTRPALVVGDGARRYAEEVYLWTGRPPVADPDDRGGGPQPVALALLELAEWPGAVAAVADPATREPIYGRLAEAQVKWEARHGRPLPGSAGPRD